MILKYIMDHVMTFMNIKWKRYTEVFVGLPIMALYVTLPEGTVSISFIKKISIS
jgi:hypothetical protein